MKKYVLEYSGYTHDYFFNLGDEIQSLAAVQLLGEIEGFLPRDSLHLSSVTGVLSMNGFFMGSENWPPHNSIIPVFYSFHLDKQYENIVCSRAGVEYLKKYEPVGCRDEGTVQILKKYGVNAFYSGCLTLTFPMRSKEESKKAEKIFLVGVDKKIEKIIPKALRKNAITINQSAIKLPKISSELKRGLALELLEGYKYDAKLVVTSKIHCAMPCLAMGIPVVFLYPKDKMDDYRVHLLKEFIPINYVTRSSVVSRIGLQKIFSDKIDWDPKPLEFEERKKTIIEGFNQALVRAALI